MTHEQLKSAIFVVWFVMLEGKSLDDLGAAGRNYAKKCKARMQDVKAVAEALRPLVTKK